MSTALAIVGAVVSGLAAVVGTILWLRRTLSNEVDLETARAAVKEARERVLQHEEAEASARNQRLEKINAEADRASNDAAAAAELLRAATNPPGTDTAKVSDR